MGLAGAGLSGPLGSSSEEALVEGKQLLLGERSEGALPDGRIILLGCPITFDRQQYEAAIGAVTLHSSGSRQ